MRPAGAYGHKPDTATSQSVEEEENTEGLQAPAQKPPHRMGSGLVSPRERGYAEAPAACYSGFKDKHHSTQKNLAVNTTSLRRKSTAKPLRLLSLIAKPEASPGPKEATAASPDHQPARACLGLPGPGEAAVGQGTAGHSPSGFSLCDSTAVIHVLLYSYSRKERGLFSGLDNADCSQALPGSTG